MTHKARNPRSSARPKLVTESFRQEHTVVDPPWPVCVDGCPIEISCAACGCTIDEWIQGRKNFCKKVTESIRFERADGRGSGLLTSLIESTARGIWLQ